VAALPAFSNSPAPCWTPSGLPRNWFSGSSRNEIIGVRKPTPALSSACSGFPFEPSSLMAALGVPARSDDSHSSFVMAVVAVRSSFSRALIVPASVAVVIGRPR
jgi:hypothetical protein